MNLMKKTSISVSLLIFILFLGLVGINLFIPFTAAQTSNPTEVLYLGEENEHVAKALMLDSDNMHVTVQNPSNVDLSNLDEYDVVVINDVLISASARSTLVSWGSQTDHGIMVIMGPQLTADSSLLVDLGISTSNSFSNNSGYINEPDELNDKKGLSLVSDEFKNSTLPFISSVVWNTAPETFYFTLMTNLTPEIKTIVRMQWTDANFTKTNYPLIAGRSLGSNNHLNVYVFTGWFQNEFDDTDSNQHFMVWLYFNYLMYSTAQSTVSYPNIPLYGDWLGSPVPHFQARLILGIVVLLIGVGSTVAYYYVRKNKKEHREIFISDEIIVDKKEKEEIPADEIFVDKSDKWEVVGMHRQIAGFFKLFFVMILLLIPQLIVTSFVMPVYLNPYPQSSGWYSYTLHFFEAIWLVFDMGFNFAITKFFAQHRIERPEKAYHYVQLFIWWEILSGVAQVFFVAFIGSFIFPHTNFSYLSWMFVVHSLIQFPGIFLVFQYFFQAYQRTDFSMISFALQVFVLRLALQIATVPIFKAIFANNIMYGPAFGAGIGMLVGQLLGDWVLFGITLKMYKSLKLPLLPIFTADFTKSEFVETFKFGGKMVLGQMWVPLGWLLQVFLVAIYLPNSSAEQGYFELAYTVSTIPQAISLLMTSMLGGLTEAYEYKKTNLHNYTSFSGTKWGSLWTFYLVSTFLAIGGPFILGASGPNWARAASLIPLLMLFQALGPTSWQADYEFAAANKPIYAGIAWIVEQFIRGILTFVLLAEMHVMEAVIIAYIISLSIKNVLVLILIRTKIHKWDWNVWQAYIAPLLSAAVNYLILRGVIFLVIDVMFGGEYNIINAIILFVIGMFAMEYIYAFIDGLFGGFCDNTLSELDVATNMVTGVKGLARGYYKMVALGAKLSPLHNKFKIKVYDDAFREAQELTDIKKKVVKN
ncbi:MAG: lipopolysaccharide biosynthesis protein [Candidatus Lokiarchaeota archaeon]|nr:lipopolysaccharide biosynthesis protein [Candidatus Harpocratesius repetitus]